MLNDRVFVALDLTEKQKIQTDMIDKNVLNDRWVRRRIN